MIAPSAFASSMIFVARNELGCGEFGGDNFGPDIDRYCRRPATGGAWCAAFMSYVAELAASRISMVCPIRRSHGAKELFRRFARAGRKVKTPQAGDIICWNRGKKGSWQGHIGIIEQIDDWGMLECIEGNVGSYPGTVRRLWHDPTHERIYGYARV